ncbi:sialic acid-binding Ig-like lectin 10 isoform X1 [Gadus macrocephalus]|uniref:sialic acid-binding Ig-like lectin 10 isoform X1 n=1 Tax=Gadus macrocephalus TaxID=80720 RepID=UPI0028CBB8DE|nr:sialic acid-binding Ig-like lectin 10 isoform X1 [Gadus macrocephalus]
MNLRSAARGFLAVLLSVPALQVNGGWRVTYSSSNVCSLRGEIVYLSCTYEYPNNVQYGPTTFNTLWFTKVSNKQPVDLEHDADYTGRVESSCGLVKCTGSRCHGTCKLRIRDLRQTDSAFYKFRFNTNQPGGENTGDPGVKLSVQDLQVKVSFPHPTDPTHAELECRSRCGLADDPPYIWFRNGQNVGKGVNYRADIQSADSFSCSVDGHNLRSPLVYGPQQPSVYSSPSGELEVGSSVTLSCSSDANPAANYTWFREHEVSVKESGQNYTITHITSDLGGNYYCQAHNAIGLYNSTFLFIKVSSSSHTATVAVRTIGVFVLTILLLVFFCMRRKRASRKACGQAGRPDTVDELLPVPVYENASELANRLAPAAQREPIEEQDVFDCASIYTSLSENQEVPCCLAGSIGQSEQADAVFYSVVKNKRPNAVPGESDQKETAETSELYSTVKK